MKERIEAVLSAVAALRDALPDLVSAVAAESGFDPRALGVWLERWCTSIRAADVERLVATATRPLGSGPVLTLAPGNVPVVAAECLILGALANVPHALALSSRGQHLARALYVELGSRLPLSAEISVWRELSPARRAELLGGSRRVVVYGTAETVEWLAARVPSRTTVVPHGPSLAAGWIEPARLSPDEIRRALRDFANDVAAYDQRGCRSPHLLLVQGSDVEARAAAELLAELLDGVNAEAPRGTLTEAERVAGFLDRLTSRSLGDVWPGRASFVSLEVHPRALRPSPLGRTVRVVATDEAGLAALLSTLPAPLGVLATPDGSRPGGPWPQTLEVQPMGTLHASRFDRLHDGRHRLDELLSPNR